MFQRLSASKLPIAAACPGAFALEAHALPASEWAARGTAIHRFVDTAFRESRDVALAELADDEKLAVFCQKIPLHEITAHFGGEPRTEIQFAYNPERDIAAEIESGHTIADGWLGGKIDGHRADGSGVRGADWKTGFVRVPAPLQNLQLRAYALMLARRYDVERVEFAVVDIDEEGFPFVRNAVFEEMELDAARAEIREIMAAVAAERFVAESRAAGTLLAPPRLRVGDHCRYCEALPSCPAFVGTTQALVPLASRTLELTPAEIGRQWEAAGAVRIALERFESAVRFQVERGLIVPLPSGKELRAVEVPSRTVNAKITEEVLEEMGMGLAYRTASKVTLAGIERATGDRAADVLAEIEKRGGVTTKTFTQVRESKPKKEK